MPPAPASALPMSNLDRCIALRLVHGAGCLPKKKKSHLHAATCSTSQRLSVVSCVGCLVFHVLHVLTTSQRLPGSQAPRLPDSDRQKTLFFSFFHCCCETRTKESNMNAKFSGACRDNRMKEFNMRAIFSRCSPISKHGPRSTTCVPLAQECFETRPRSRNMCTSFSGV